MEKPTLIPRKENYGYEEPSYQSEGGWMIEGGEEAYEFAMEMYELALIQYYKYMAEVDGGKDIENTDDV